VRLIFLRSNLALVDLHGADQSSALKELRKTLNNARKKRESGYESFTNISQFSASQNIGQ